MAQGLFRYSRNPIFLGMRINLGPLVLLQMLLTTLPLALFAGAVQLTVATFARSFKEAQTYLSLTLFLPMVPGLVVAFNPVNPTLWMYATPVLAQQLLLADLLRGEAAGWLPQVVAMTSTVGLGLLFVALTVRLFHRETLLFSD